MECDLAVGVELDLLPGVNEVLHSGRVKVRDGREVEDDRPDARSGVLLDLLLGSLAVLRQPPDRSRAVPGSVAELGRGFALARPSVRPDMVDEDVGVVGRVGVQERLGEPEDDDAGGGWLDLDLGLGVVGVERNVDVSDLLHTGLAVFRLGLDSNADSTEERSSGHGDSDEEQRERRTDRRVNTVLDGREDSDEDGGEEDDTLEGGDSPETVGSSGRDDEVADGSDDDGREGRVGDEVEGVG